MKLTPRTALLVCLASCSSTQPALIGPTGDPLEPYSADQIAAEASSLMKTKGIDNRGQTILSERLEDFLARETTKELLSTKGATAVGVYHSADGGFLIKGGGGEGLVTFHGGAKAASFQVSATSYGAVIGGGSNHGIFVVFGLEDHRRFAGHYSSGAVKATAGPAGVSSGIVRYDGGNHEVRYLATGWGASADAGFGSVTIEMTK